MASRSPRSLRSAWSTNPHSPASALPWPVVWLPFTKEAAFRVLYGRVLPDLPYRAGEDRRDAPCGRLRLRSEGLLTMALAQRRLSRIVEEPGVVPIPDARRRPQFARPANVV